MTRDERTVLIATCGLATTALGAFLPWARIGGRSRSGFSTADTFISLAGPLPDAIAWVGRWWYLPALLVVVAWATTFMRGHWSVRILGTVLVGISLAMWWLFVWAGRHYNVLNSLLVGPIVSTLGLLVVMWACLQRRDSLLRPTPGPVQA